MSADLFIRVTDEGRHQCYRLLNGLYKLDVGESFATGREAIDFCNRAAANRTRPDATDAPEVAPDGGSRSDGPASGRPGASYSEVRP